MKNKQSKVQKIITPFLLATIILHTIYFAPLIIEQVTFPWYNNYYDAGDRFGFNFLGWYFYGIIFLSLNNLWVFLTIGEKKWHFFLLVFLVSLEILFFIFWLPYSLGLASIVIFFLIIQGFLLTSFNNKIYILLLLLFIYLVPLWFFYHQNKRIENIWPTNPAERDLINND